MNYIKGARRPDGGTYENATPITNLYEALDILHESSGDSREGRYIFTAGKVPEIRRGWYTEGSSGGDTSGTEYYLVDPALIEEIAKKRYAAPLTAPRIGRTIPSPDRLVLTDLGLNVLVGYLDRELTHARQMRRRKNESVDFRLIGRGREHGSFGPLYYEFRNMKTGNRSRAYPKTGKIKQISNP